MSTATAAMKQAESAYKELQQNEEAKKWAEQVKGLGNLDVSALRTYGKGQTIPKQTSTLRTLPNSS